MSTVNSAETTDTKWKVLVTAIEKASIDQEGLRERTSSVKSYEQFVEETNYAKSRKEKPKLDDDSNDIFKPGSDKGVYVLGDWRSSDDEETCDDESISGKDENYNYKVVKQKKQKLKRNYHPSRLQVIAEDREELRDYYSSSSSSDDKVHSNFQDDYVDVYKEEDESSWESISLSSDDGKNLDDFLKTSKSKRDDADSDHDVSRFLPYTNLSQCLISQYYPDSENVYTHQDDNHHCQSEFNNINDKRKRKIDYNKDFTRHGQLSLEERLPMIQVLDTLENVNKVLKEGKLTPRMERILEYKQDYPFSEGYEEEQLGWCPWLVYKFEKLWKRISEKQWPH